MSYIYLGMLILMSTCANIYSLVSGDWGAWYHCTDLVVDYTSSLF